MPLQGPLEVGVKLKESLEKKFAKEHAHHTAPFGSSPLMALFRHGFLEASGKIKLNKGPEEVIAFMEEAEQKAYSLNVLPLGVQGNPNQKYSLDLLQDHGDAGQAWHVFGEVFGTFISAVAFYFPNKGEATSLQIGRCEHLFGSFVGAFGYTSSPIGNFQNFLPIAEAAVQFGLARVRANQTLPHETTMRMRSSYEIMRNHSNHWQRAYATWHKQVDIRQKMEALIQSERFELFDEFLAQLFDWMMDEISYWVCTAFLQAMQKWYTQEREASTQIQASQLFLKLETHTENLLRAFDGRWKLNVFRKYENEAVDTSYWSEFGETLGKINYHLFASLPKQSLERTEADKVKAEIDRLFHHLFITLKLPELGEGFRLGFEYALGRMKEMDKQNTALYVHYTELARKAHSGRA